MQERATHMGCGVLRQRRHRKWHEQFIVCNFARKDMVHEPAYEVYSHPASGCLAGVNPLYPNLCALEEHYDVNALDRFHTKKSSLKIKVLYSEPKAAKGKALEEHFDVKAMDRNHTKKPPLEIKIQYSEPKTAEGAASLPKKASG